MKKEYAATNGWKLKLDSNGTPTQAINPRGDTVQFLNQRVAETMEEYALAKRGLWPTSDGCLVQRTPQFDEDRPGGESIRVIDQNGDTNIFWRTLWDHEEHPLWEASREYFSAHPTEKVGKA